MKTILCRMGVVFFAATQFCSAQTAGAPADSTRTIRSTAREVLLDFVVRDKHEKAVRDLRPEEIEVYEDGVRQDVRAFRLIEGREAREAEKQLTNELTRDKTALNPVRQINLVSIVFQPMAWENRKNAKDAADEFIKSELRPNTYIGVFSLDRRLNALANFTNNRELLLKTIAKATTGAYSEFAKISESVMKATEFTATGGQGGVSVQGGGPDFTSSSASTLQADVAIGEASAIMYGILNRERLHFNTINGMEQMDSLLTLIQEQARLPGRKTVVLFTQGLPVPANFMERFRFVISTANRAGVSFYGVDVGGLTTFSRSGANLAMTRALNTAPASGLENVAADPSFYADDMLQHSLRAANTQETLAQLADDTGGFMIANTNEWKKQLRKVMEDVNTHYEIAYAPKSDLNDGGFRKIELKISRPNITLQSRKGYFALPELNGRPLMPFEVACLQALDTKPRVHAFEFQSAALRYRPGATVQHEVVFEVPVRNVGAKEDQKAGTRALHASLMALIKDAKGEVVGKISRDLSLAVPNDKFAQFERGNIIYTEPVYLPPGRYTMESAVIDRINDAASVVRSALVVQAPASGPEVSAPVLVRSLEPRKEAPDAADAMQFAGGKVTPTLSSTMPQGANPAIYFVVYPTGKATGPLSVNVEFFKEGKLVGKENPQTGNPVADGIPMIVSPKLPAGTYDVRITAIDGPLAARQNTVLTVE